MKKRKKRALIAISCAVGCLAVACLIGLAVAGSLWGIPPFGGLFDMRIAKLAGNAERYDIENIEELAESPLKGMDILYLGSSVTFGAYSQGTAFPEYIAARNGTTFVKEAVSGTTLADGRNSYISRLEKVDNNRRFDLFVCQLSTNDAAQNKPIGEVVGSETQNYDTSTVCGAIEYMIDYIGDTWGCPVVFYTNSYYESEAYAAMVGALKEIQGQYGIGVIDLYSDEVFNAVTEEQRVLYMADDIHPTKAGYLEWWTPRMEEYLYEFIK